MIKTHIKRERLSFPAPFFCRFLLTAALFAPSLALGGEPPLSESEKHVLDMVRKEQGKSIAPFSSGQGGVRYVFGASTPFIICAPLQVCDVALQEGERVNSLNLGDAARWNVEPAFTGEAENGLWHLIIKPLDVDLQTSLVVTTTRRTYHFRLKSHPTRFMPRISFSYPEEVLEKWQEEARAQTRERERSTLPDTGENINSLNFGYLISGSAPFRPIRVYDNGSRTMIEMPASMKSREAPVLLLLRPSSGTSRVAEKALVNYRLIGTRFIVDALFDEAILVAGTGKAKSQILIRRRRP